MDGMTPGSGMQMPRHRMREFFQNVDMDANASEGMLEWMRTRILVKAFAVFWAAAPKGSITYAFTHMGDFPLLLLLPLLPRPPPPQI